MRYPNLNLEGRTKVTFVGHEGRDTMTWAIFPLKYLHQWNYMNSVLSRYITLPMSRPIANSDIYTLTLRPFFYPYIRVLARNP